ncbi:alkaline shock response membrane anchor protein AmaP [Micromonosporaceae bacterium Da 78-11]
MRRSVLGLDRILAVLLGLILFIVGIGAAAWYNGGLRRLWPQFPKQVSTDRTSDLLNTGWWPWAAGGAGVLAVLLGLWWLIAHLPRRGVGNLVLPGSGKPGRLLVDPAGVATTAAEVLADTPGIRSVHSKVIRDRGELVVTLTGTIDPRADLTDVVAATDAVAADLQTVLGRDDARARIHLSVARRPRTQPRVH